MMHPQAAPQGNLIGAALLLATALLSSAAGQTIHSVDVNWADSWAPGQHFVSLTGNGCERYYFRITVGGKFWVLDIFNPTSCNCCPGCCSEDPFGAFPWPRRSLHPMTVRFYDRRDDRLTLLQTRHNSPQSMVHLPTTVTIAHALDQRLVSDRMRFEVEITPTEQTILRHSGTVQYCSFANSLSPVTTYRVDVQMDSNNYQNAMAIQLFYYGQWTGITGSSGDPRMFWFWRRKGLTPPNTFRWEHASNNGVTRRTNALTQGWQEVAPFGTRGNFYCISSNCQCSRPFTVTLRFFETHREYVATALVSRAVLLAATPAEGDWLDIPCNVSGSFHTFTIRVVWSNISMQADNKEMARAYYSLYILQPFNLQDVLVYIYDDDDDHIMFRDVETHVPYREPSSLEGQIGWPLAIDFWTRRTQAPPRNQRFRVEIKYNRRTRIASNRENQVRAVLLQDWARDEGGSVDDVIVPIPQSVLNTPDLMGAVARRAFTAGEVVLSTERNSTISGVSAMRWFNRTYSARLMADQRWNDTWNIYYNNTRHDRSALAMAMMATLRHPDPLLMWSFNYFPLLDSFFPFKPLDLPLFWEDWMITQLFGFSELARLLRDLLKQWQHEYEIIADVIPLFHRHVSLERWLFTRSYIIRSAFDMGPAEADIVIIPVENMFRRRATTNCHFTFDAATARLQVVASAPISVQDELSMDHGAAGMTKIEYLIAYGQMHTQAADGATMPGTTLILRRSDASRLAITEFYQEEFALSWVDATYMTLEKIKKRIEQIPVEISGVGVSTEMVDIAVALRTMEESVLKWNEGRAESDHDAAVAAAAAAAAPL